MESRYPSFANNMTLTGGSNYYTNVNEEILKDLEQMGNITSVVVPVATVVILILGLLGNALVVFVTVVTKRMTNHPVHSLFVLNLVAADILFLLVSGPYWVTINSTASWRFGAFLCPTISFLSNCSMAASINTICALAWMRFMALIMPFRFQRSCISTMKASYLVIVLIWVVGIAFSCPILVYRGLKELKLHGEKIMECRWDGKRSLHIFEWAKLLSTYFLPLILVTVFYAIICREVLCYMRRHSNSNSCPDTNMSKEERRECRKSTMVVLSLILAFLVCWFPHSLETVFKFADVYSGPSNAKSRFILQSLAKCMSYAHACVNPFIYTFTSPIFRLSLSSIVRRNIKNCQSGRDRRSGGFFRTLRFSQREEAKRFRNGVNYQSAPMAAKKGNALVDMVAEGPSGNIDMAIVPSPLTIGEFEAPESQASCKTTLITELSHQNTNDGELEESQLLQKQTIYDLKKHCMKLNGASISHSIAVEDC